MIALYLSVFLGLSASLAAEVKPAGFTCTSSAQFMENDTLIIPADVKSVSSGFVAAQRNVNNGIQLFHHSFGQYKVVTGIQTGIVSRNDRVGEPNGSVDYFLFENADPMAKILRSATFESTQAPLPESFELGFFEDIKLSPVMKVRLRVNCTKLF